jgi:hypothetical protein
VLTALVTQPQVLRRQTRISQLVTMFRVHGWVPCDAGRSLHAAGPHLRQLRHGVQRILHAVGGAEGIHNLDIPARRTDSGLPYSPQNRHWLQAQWHRPQAKGVAMNELQLGASPSCCRCCHGHSSHGHSSQHSAHSTPSMVSETLSLVMAVCTDTMAKSWLVTSCG